MFKLKKDYNYFDVVRSIVERNVKFNKSNLAVIEILEDINKLKNISNKDYKNCFKYCNYEDMLENNEKAYSIFFKKTKSKLMFSETLALFELFEELTNPYNLILKSLLYHHNDIAYYVSSFRFYEHDNYNNSNEIYKLLRFLMMSKSYKNNKVLFHILKNSVVLEILVNRREMVKSLLLKDNILKYSKSFELEVAGLKNEKTKDSYYRLLEIKDYLRLSEILLGLKEIN